MKTILLIGAGTSSAVLIDYLLKEAAENNWKFIIADADIKQVLSKTNHSRFARAVQIDITNDEQRSTLIRECHVVISMMPPNLHFLIAKDCVEYRKHLLTASYLDPQIKSLQDEINHRKLFFLCEMGLDPGIDHMSAMHLLDDIKSAGGVVTSFKSHCGGLVAPESDDNPWHYKISWNPRNIVLAGKAGAVYKLNGDTTEENYEILFNAHRNIATGYNEMPVLSYYPNRNSLPYIDLYKLHDAASFVRTTLRHPDFMYGWQNIIDLKLTAENAVYETDGKSLQDFFRQHLEENGFGEWLQDKLHERFTESKNLLENLMNIMDAEEKAKETGEELPDNFMLVNESGDLKDIGVDDIKNNAAAAMAGKLHEANLIMKQLFFLGLDDNETMINKGLCSAADVLQFALEKKLALLPGDKDLIVMLHEIEYVENGKQHSIHSSLVVKGEDHIHTAMAKTVGLPLGIAAKLILNEELKMTGLHIPVTKQIYEPVLNELKKYGVIFSDTRKEM